MLFESQLAHWETRYPAILSSFPPPPSRAWWVRVDMCFRAVRAYRYMPVKQYHAYSTSAAFFWCWVHLSSIHVYQVQAACRSTVYEYHSSSITPVVSVSTDRVPVLKSTAAAAALKRPQQKSRVPGCGVAKSRALPLTQTPTEISPPLRDPHLRANTLAGSARRAEVTSKCLAAALGRCCHVLLLLPLLVGVP